MGHRLRDSRGAGRAVARTPFIILKTFTGYLESIEWEWKRRQFFSKFAASNLYGTDNRFCSGRSHFDWFDRLTAGKLRASNNNCKPPARRAADLSATSCSLSRTDRADNRHWSINNINEHKRAACRHYRRHDWNKW